MTKREARIQLLADLNLPEQGVLWDLGAGTGSVGLEALRLRPQLKLLAVEPPGGGAALIQANAERLGVAATAVLEMDAVALSAPARRACSIRTGFCSAAAEQTAPACSVRCWSGWLRGEPW